MWTRPQFSFLHTDTRHATTPTARRRPPISIEIQPTGDRWKPKHAGRTAQGADKWLGFSKHTSTEACYSALRQQGCRIYVASCDPAGGPAVPPYAETRGVGGGIRVTAPSVPAGPAAPPPPPLPPAVTRPSTPMSNVNWTASPRLAVVFGNEYMGLSNAAVELVRACVASLR